MYPTTMVQISTEMPQDLFDENRTERNTDESVFASLGDCEDGAFVVTLNAIMLTISFCGLVANALVLWLLGFCIKRDPFSVYILNLAGADFFYLCCQIVRSIMLIGQDFWDVVPAFIITLTISFYTLGLHLLAAISLERCLSVFFPVWYRCCRPKHTSATMCSLLWTLYLLGNLLQGEVCGFLGFIPPWVMSCVAWDFSFVMLILFLLCLLCVSSLTLILKFQCHAQHRGPSKHYLLILVTILMFLLCGLPFGICCFLLYWLIDTRIPTWIKLEEQWSSYLPYVYSSDPLLCPDIV
uniref:Mas-related G-protein coupled receptor member X2-like isoform X1 n=1 Tax=Phascolarctos cinereus TaxID=38626 RepID=A0A6P5IWP5_PHACI|nr:mas-related G-protein coupled receptor member X2-like isoform X1 [Phascolarctos cinereus]XP_020826542.1 mas-related G-protein coupled receptor member X2-like isoform X1 [Phascolarctos cinereus]XP_020826543.1 mas-related G-protein coupled receptor member X2-like isoform X1 [Phascolarctos cinereus]XP_020826544.1 mas-related G-protein coupled receptor member X2-like isoform X1 [Phascolarctos cinereus]XP_020826545.1 mas-related G-protein coupled receptor member X2-like isoform X1 [Phascolarctos 